MAEDLPHELSRWAGAEARVWAFEVSHKKLTVRLQMPGRPELLDIVCVGTTSIAGPTRWAKAQMFFLVKSGLKVLTDPEAGFVLTCSDIVLAPPR